MTRHSCAVHMLVYCYLFAPQHDMTAKAELLITQISDD